MMKKNDRGSSLKGVRKTRKTRSQDGIRTGHLPDAGPERYGYTSLVYSMKTALRQIKSKFIITLH